MEVQRLSPGGQQILSAFGHSESMVLRDLIRASGLSRVQFTPQLRKLLSLKCLSVRVVSASGASISQRIDGHQGKQVFIIPYRGVEAAVVSPAVTESAELLLLQEENKTLKRRIEELERYCENFGRRYSEQELRQIVQHLQGSS